MDQITESKPVSLFYISVIEQNAGWGAEYFVNRGFIKNGVKTITLDYRKNRGRIAREYLTIKEDFDALLLQRGDCFPIELLRAVSRPRFFWASELISRNRDQDRLLSSGVFDHIFVHSDSCKKAAIDIFHLQPDRVSVLINGFDETVQYRKEGVEKDIDVLFIGNLGFKHRRETIDKLRSMCSIQVLSAFGKDLTDYFNRARIVLNIHAEDYLDTETRVFEALGCGAFLISEKLSTENPFKPNTHYIEVNDANEMAEKIKYYLAHEKEREIVANAGFSEALQKHTYIQRAAGILAVMKPYFENNEKVVPAIDLKAVKRKAIFEELKDTGKRIFRTLLLDTRSSP